MNLQELLDLVEQPRKRVLIFVRGQHALNDTCMAIVNAANERHLYPLVNSSSRSIQIGDRGSIIYLRIAHSGSYYHVAGTRWDAMYGTEVFDNMPDDKKNTDWAGIKARLWTLVRPDERPFIDGEDNA